MSGMLFGIGPRNAPTFVLVVFLFRDRIVRTTFRRARLRIDPAEQLR